MRLGLGCIALLATCVAMPNLTSAQQPGTPNYNRVLIPAHGGGDTRQSRSVWGAFAISPVNQWSGWALTGASRDDAVSLATSRCQEKGGLDCEVKFVFADTCAAVASSETAHSYMWGYGLQQVKTMALEACGAACSIVLEGCTSGR